VCYMLVCEFMVSVKDGPHNPNFSFNITTHKPKHHLILLHGLTWDFLQTITCFSECGFLCCSVHCTAVPVPKIESCCRICHKVCKLQYSYIGASKNADDDAGMPVCCVNQAVLVPVLKYLFQLFLSVCLLCVMLQPEMEPVIQNPFTYL
jgi:hypothetical protein